MDPIKQFEQERELQIKKIGQNQGLKKLGLEFIIQSFPDKYSYNFSWLGRPIIQHPQDIVAIQELIWKIQPDLIIETGVAHGGSLILSASILELIGKEARVIGIDIDIREHNRNAIENHPMMRRIDLIEGSSVESSVLHRVRQLAESKKSILVFLDSNHSHAHVLKELELYSPLVTPGSYIVVFDTIAEFLPEGAIVDRPWGKGNSPYTAIQEFLSRADEFFIDRSIEDSLVITSAPGGFLRRIS